MLASCPDYVLNIEIGSGKLNDCVLSRAVFIIMILFASTIQVLHFACAFFTCFKETFPDKYFSLLTTLPPGTFS